VNRDQKAAVVDRVAGQIEAADAVIAVDYRGLSVKQASDLRTSLREADANFQIVKNTLTERAAEQAGAEHLKALLDGPTALTFVKGDLAVAAKALARFRREAGILEWKGGQMGGEPLSPDEIESISRLPAREMLHAQLVGTIASPLTGLVRGLASMISGLASQLQQIADQGLVQGEAPAAEEPAAAEEPPAEAEASTPEEPAAEADGGEGETEAADAPADAPEEAPAETEPAEQAAEEAAEEAPAEEPPASDAEAPGDPVAEAEAAEQEQTSDTPSEGEGTEEG
jgi:large subunit ribosomal protein L10